MVLVQKELYAAYIGEWYVVPTSITLDKSAISLSTAGDTSQLTATILPAEAKQTVTWTSSNTSIATVDNTGLVTCVTPGECTITATTANGLTATCSVQEARLPSAYQEVEWIQSDGGQWINTGYNPITGSKAEISYRPISRTASKELWIFAIWSGGVRWRAGLNTSGVGETGYGFTYSPSVSVGTDTIATGSYNSSSSYPMYLFAQDENGSVYHLNQGQQRLYYCKVRTGGTLVREMYPCYRKLDSVIGMYDIVNDTFYTNSGSGTFTKGGDV